MWYILESPLTDGIGIMSFEDVDALKKRLDSYRPIPQAILNNLHEELVLQWTYNSNAIEGNTLTLKETKVALEGITVGGKTIREHFEALNHREAILFVEELVQKGSALTVWDIKSIHALVLKNIDSDNAGAFRQSNVIISGVEHRPTEFLKVPEEMEAFITWYSGDAQNLHPVERAARIHCDFVKIHPFIDGNGRTSRLLMNFELIKNGFPAAVIPVSERLAYYSALDLAHTTSDYQPFIELVTKVVVKSFDLYWYALGV